MDGESLDIKHDRLQRLKELFPEVFTENEVDWEKVKAVFGEDINFANERYVLNWAGKSDAFKVLQQPTTATLKPVPEESVLTTPLFPLLERGGSGERGVVDFISSTTQNLFIEGENLEVLKVLQKAYYGKVKCIIIDPPYNTGSDSFIYPDRFSEKKEDYLKRIGDKDEEGFLMKEGIFRKNSKDSGHYHSNWLSMMYPRLFLAKNLLRDDGVIFVHIDDNEVHNLRMVMNEIFGEENFIASFIWKKKGTTTNVEGAKVSSLTEYIVCYQKLKDGLNYRVVPKANRNYPLSDELGNYRTTVIEKKNIGDYERKTMQFEILGQKPREGKRWQIGEDTARELEKKGRFFIDNGIVKLKIYDFEDKDTTSANPNLLFEHGSTDSATSELDELLGIEGLFDNPKPKQLISQLIQYCESPDENDIILDFFAGSGTTAQAILEFNSQKSNTAPKRIKFIVVQMPEPCDENSEAYKAGYKTIADIGKERIRRVIGKIDKEVIASEAKQSQGNLLAATEIASSQTPRNDTKPDLGFRVFKLSPSNFKIWRGDEINSEEKLTEQLDAFTNPIRPGAEKQNMLYELMLKAGYGLTSSIQHVIASGAKQSQKGKKIASGSSNHRNDSIGFYIINNNELIIALDAMNEKLIEQIIAAKPQKVITLDSLFTGNDQLKTNTVLQMRDAGVDFKTI